MRVALVIPFRDSADGSRASALGVALPLLERLYPWDYVQLADANPSVPFNRAASRNLAAQNALGVAEVLVVCDADSVPTVAGLKAAIDGAYADGLCHFPFDTVRDYDINGDIRQEYGPSEGGCWVIRPESWIAAGGQEERLSGWGQEDRIFLITAHTLLGKSVIHPGVLETIWHSRDSLYFDPKDQALFEQFNRFYGDPIGLRALLDERDSDG